LPRVCNQSSLTYAVADLHNTPCLYLDSTTATPTWRQYTAYGDARGVAVTAPDNRGFLNKPMDLTTGLTIVGAQRSEVVRAAGARCRRHGDVRAVQRL